MYIDSDLTVIIHLPSSLLSSFVFPLPVPSPLPPAEVVELIETPISTWARVVLIVAAVFAVHRLELYGREGAGFVEFQCAGYTSLVIAVVEWCMVRARVACVCAFVSAVSLRAIF